MLEGLELRRQPLVFSQTGMDILLKAYKEQIGEDLQPDENGVYKIYGYDIIVFDRWDESDEIREQRIIQENSYGFGVNVDDFLWMQNRKPC